MCFPVLLQSVVHPPRVLDRLTDWLGLGDSELTGKLLQAFIIVALAWAAIGVLRFFARRVERAAHGHGHGESRGETLARLVQSVGAAVIGVVAFLMALSLFVNIAPLLAGVGIAGLAVSFGAQSLVKDVIAGFFILLENQYQLGDTVRIAGVEGTVSHLTLRATVLRDGSGVVHFIPNGQIAVVSNQTRTWSRAVVDVGVAYGADIDRVMGVLRALIADLSQRSGLVSPADGRERRVRYPAARRLGGDHPGVGQHPTRHAGRREERVVPAHQVHIRTRRNRDAVSSARRASDK